MHIILGYLGFLFDFFGQTRTCDVVFTSNVAVAPEENFLRFGL